MGGVEEEVEGWGGLLSEMEVLGMLLRASSFPPPSLPSEFFLSVVHFDANAFQGIRAV